MLTFWSRTYKVCVWCVWTFKHGIMKKWKCVFHCWCVDIILLVGWFAVIVDHHDKHTDERLLLKERGERLPNCRRVLGSRWIKLDADGQALAIGETKYASITTNYFLYKCLFKNFFYILQCKRYSSVFWYTHFCTLLPVCCCLWDQWW